MHAIHECLRPVVKRQRRARAIHGASWGLLYGAAAALALLTLRMATGWPPGYGLAALCLLLGPALGALRALARPTNWRAAARAIDQRYRLKDRAVTALRNVDRCQWEPFQLLQVEEALQHLERVDARETVSLRPPRVLPAAALASLVALALLAWPLAQRDASATTLQREPQILAETDRIEEDLKEFEELARETEDPELKELIEALRKLNEEMREPGVDTREALAKLSEMQSAIQAQQSQYNVGLVDAQMQSIGEALSLADSLNDAGKALVNADYDKAAELLEKMPDPNLEKRDARAVAEKLREASSEAGQAGLGSLSESTEEMAGECEGKQRWGRGARSMAKLAKQQGRRRAINAALANQLGKLGECKGNCNSNSMAKGRKPGKSNSPTSNFGRTTSGNVRGDKTPQPKSGRLEEITGLPGEGPTNVETTHSVEGRQTAAREYRDVYKKYQRMSEQALDSEAIPLGHRQTIRKYFELIRPEQEAAESPAAAPTGAPVPSGNPAG